MHDIFFLLGLIKEKLKLRYSEILKFLISIFPPSPKKGGNNNDDNNCNHNNKEKDKPARLNLISPPQLICE